MWNVHFSFLCTMWREVYFWINFKTIDQTYYLLRLSGSHTKKQALLNNFRTEVIVSTVKQSSGAANKQSNHPKGSAPRTRQREAVTYLVLGRFCRVLSRMRDGALLLRSASVFIFCGKKTKMKTTRLVKRENASFSIQFKFHGAREGILPSPYGAKITTSKPGYCASKGSVGGQHF